MGAARGRSPGGARWSCHSRTSPAVPRSRPSSGSLTTSPGSRTGRPTSCLLRTGTTPRRWRTSSGCSSRIATSSRRRSRCGALPRGGGQAWRARAGRRGGHWVCSATGGGRPTSGSSCHPSTTCARRSRLPSVRWAFRTPWKDRDGSRALRSAVPAGVAALRLARGRTVGSLRVSPFSVLRASPFPGRLCGGPPTRAGGVGPGKGRGGDGATARQTDCPSRTARVRPAAGGRRHTLRWMLQSAWGLERPPVDGRAEIDLQAEEAVEASSVSWRPGTRSAVRRDRTRSSPRSNEPRRTPARVSRGASSSSTCCARGRAASDRLRARPGGGRAASAVS